ncbi:hypothetical protein [Serratia marcescens]|uniref:Uncharacterized protein n=1 Tax=Serratia marcescens TaxID=615 RepID=A0AAP8TPE3_SERMA|nr:hypothetical protein [Serratia marcescens]PNO69169.1 hypothetical protein MC70_003815 [Serratia marcescens]BEN31774.1 hypothetical protein SMKC034_29900 [Serratia marcescens]
MYIIHQLLRPFGYLNIKGVSGKFIYDWVIPLILSLISICYLIFAINSPDALLGNDGFFKSVISFISILPGFYIAALAAIATFNRKQIDDPLISDSGTPYIYVKGVKENGKPYRTKEDITRRLFLCMLFSFLTAESILLIMLHNFAIPLIATTTPPLYLNMYLFVFLLILWQLLVTTFFGLYYLGDRIHMSN